MCVLQQRSVNKISTVAVVWVDSCERSAMSFSTLPLNIQRPDYLTIYYVLTIKLQSLVCLIFIGFLML